MEKTQNTNTESRLMNLRMQAEEALQNGYALHSLPVQEQSVKLATLLEEMRVYQAELEIQNDELNHAIEESERLLEHYRNLFDGVSLPLLLLSPKAEILEANVSACELLKLKIDSAHRLRSVYSLVEKNSGLELSNALNACIELGAGSFDFFATLKASPQKQFSARLMRAIKDPLNQDGAALLLLRDMSVEEELSMQRQVFERVIDQSEDIILVVDSDKCVVSCNQHARITFGVGSEKPKWEALAALFPPKVMSLIVDTLDSLLLPTRPAPVFMHFEADFFNAGQRKSYLLKCFKIFVSESGDTGVGVFISDETDRLNQDNELKVALSVFNMGHQAVMITDAEANLTYVNPAFERITGYTFNEVKGQNPRILSSMRHDADFYDKFWRDVKYNGGWAGEIWNRKKSGEEYPEWLTVTRYPATGTIKNYIATFTDVSKLKKSEGKVYKLAYYDPLTGAGNRTLLKQHIDAHLAKKNTSSFGLMYLDLDRFKEVNDGHGHDTGDELLKLVVRRLTGILRQTDHIYRLGGDEFLIYMHGISAPDIAKKASQCINMMQSVFFINGVEVRVSCSIGIVMCPADGNSYETLLKHADIAMYKIKNNGKNGFHFFDQSLLEEVEHKIKLEETLRRAIHSKNVLWRYQLQTDATGTHIYGYEALFRLQNCEHAHSIDELIQIAEQSNLIHEISFLALQSALENIPRLHGGDSVKPRISVNLSVSDFESEVQFKRLINVLEVNRERAQFIDIELTESMLLENTQRKVEQLNQLKSFGCDIHIDDFGTGYSSLAYLVNFPIDILKIDQSFVRQIGSNPKSEAVCISVINLAKALSIKSLAEGVETEGQKLFLQKHGCDYLQGYLLSQPKDIEFIAAESNLD